MHARFGFTNNIVSVSPIPADSYSHLTRYPAFQVIGNEQNTADEYTITHTHTHTGTKQALILKAHTCVRVFLLTFVGVCLCILGALTLYS